MMTSWVHVHIDGAARGNPGPAGVGVVFSTPDGAPLATMHHYLGETTNNTAEYRALLAALEEAHRRNYTHLRIHTDSELLQRQIVGRYRVRSAHLLPLFRKAQSLLNRLDAYDILHVPREENQEADRLANCAIDEAAKQHTIGAERADESMK